MKPIYDTFNLNRRILSVTLTLYAHITYGDDETQTPVPAESLSGLKVELVSPKVSGARDLIASGECTLSDNHLNIGFFNLPNGLTHTLLVKMEYGTNTRVVYGLKIKTADKYGANPQPRIFSSIVNVVETYA